MREMALSNLKSNDKGQVLEIHGGRQIKKRLFELGLNRGSEIEVVKNDIGPIIINLSGHKLAIGRGLANNIVVKIN